MGCIFELLIQLLIWAMLLALLASAVLVAGPFIILIIILAWLASLVA